jgi:hypothetical protein
MIFGELQVLMNSKVLRNNAVVSPCNIRLQKSSFRRAAETNTRVLPRPETYSLQLRHSCIIGGLRWKDWSVLLGNPAAI